MNLTIDRTKDLTELWNPTAFPDEVWIVAVPPDKHACNSATDPEGTVIQGLACFPSLVDIEAYRTQIDWFEGAVCERTTFDEARELAKGKPTVQAMFLWVDGGIREIHWIR